MGLGAVQAQLSDEVCEENGTLSRETYTSAWLGQAMFYTVYLPSCYSPQETYPTLYLMHGSNDDDGHWVRLGLPAVLDEAIRNGEMPPVIAVLPFGNVIANRNRFDNVSWSNVFLTELMPDAERKYSVNDQLRAIGGISRGGFWAYQIGLRHPNLFKAIGGHSAFFDLYHAEPPDNPLHQILNAPNIETMSLWLDRGKGDYAYVGLDIMHQRMNERGLPHTYSIAEQGEHNNGYWSAQIANYVAWYAQALVPPPAIAPAATPAPLTFFATSTPDALLPVATPMPITPVGKSLFVPVVGFPSLQTTVDNATLQAVRNGGDASRLILDEETHAILQDAGVMFASNVRVLPFANLRDALWNDREAFSLLTLDRLTHQLRLLWVDEMPVFENLEAYPFWIASTAPVFDTSKLTRITASGVTALTRNTLKALDERSVEDAISGIAPYVNASDFFHTSNEVSFASDCPLLNADVLGGATSFCSKEAHFDLFTALGVDIIELTGNHNNDYGYAAYAETLDWYTKNNIQTLGGGATVAQAQRPLVMTHNGNTVAWVACNSIGPYYALANDAPELLGGVRGGAASCGGAWLSETLARAQSQADIVILTVQQFEVEDYRPLPEQERQFRAYADMGADVVIGTAPHKPQTFEFYRESFIHYGLGNLFFDQPFWGNTRFFMDTLVLYEGRLVTIELFAGIIEDNVRPRPMTLEERLNFLFFMFRQQNGF